MRGNPLGVPPWAMDVRSIPACAGEPQASQATCSLLEVYPRVCGGTLRAVIGPVGHTGLSPRVRGNLAFGAYLRE